jgi:predicted nucleotidyltransferase
MDVPSKLRSILDPFIDDLRARETISGIGLFGSWSRGDAAPSSDVDLLIVESKDFDYEYVERVEVNNCLVDLNYVPKRWVTHRVPPEIDQKIYETKVIFDRDGSLTKAKNLMLKVYWRPERVEIRTEAHLIEADTYIGRARMAFNRGDYQSTKFNSILGFCSLMKILTEIGKKPILSSFFIRNLESASKNLNMHSLYENYVKLMGLADLSKADVKVMLNMLSSVWRSIMDFTAINFSFTKSFHPKVSAKLNYYRHENFLKGLIARLMDLTEEAHIESAHYMFHVLADAITHYAFLLSAVEGVRFDYATTMKHISESKSSPAEIYHGAVNILNIKDVSKGEAEETLKSVTEAALNIRRKRKDLISQFIG